MTVFQGTKPFFTGKFETLENIDALLSDAEKIKEVRAGILRGDAFIFKKFVSQEFTRRVREYLAGIGRGSFPNYQRIDKNCPNFHRINRWDRRAFVGGSFHQFCFFPWNQDVFNLFGVFRKSYELKNLLAGYRQDQFLGAEPEEDCTARLAFQFYPRGIGELHKHRDSIEGHQGALPILILSQKGRDFKEGGAYFETQDGKKIIVDDYADDGDLVYYNPQTPHGVFKIDPAVEENWMDFQGRWMLLIAVNKLFYNTKLLNAVDLETKT